MKKLFAIIAVFGAMTFGLSQSAMAQDGVETAEAADTTEVVAQDSTEVDSAAVAPAATDEVAEDSVVEGSLHKELKTKFIEGGADFMSLVAIALVLGLAFCIERIVYLSLAEVNTKKLLESLEEKLNAGDIEGAKDIARNTRGPVASICYQGLLRINEDLDAIERSITSYGAVQATYLEKGCSWITLFIAIGTVTRILGNCDWYGHGVRPDSAGR